MFNLISSFLLELACGLRKGGVIVNGHTLTRSQTRLQLEVLGRWFDFIRLEDLPRRLGQRARKPFCLLTFDDGKRNNYIEIAPELESRGVPAVFYVTTKPLSAGTCFWFDRQGQLVKELGFCPPGLELQTLKRHHLSLITKRLDDACATYGVKAECNSDDVTPMTWDQARDLARRGFTIGAHGMTHATLTNETNERALAEIEGSLAKVSIETGAPCTTFAFPNGNYTPELAQHALRCGATTVMTTEPMWTNRRLPLWRLPRIQLFGEFDAAKIKLKIALAAVRGLLANPDGSGRAYRLKRESRPCIAAAVAPSHAR